MTSPFAPIASGRPVRPGRLRVATVAPVLAAALVVGLAFFTNIRDRVRAGRLAEAELQNRLENGERVVRRVRALQRHWFDAYRATYGVMAATDRRVLFVGVVPELHAAPDAPRAFAEQSFFYDTSFAIAPASLPLGAGGALVTSGSRAQRFAVSREGAQRLSELIAAASRQTLAIREARRRERAYYDSIAALPPIREYHRVERGEALDIIARRYETAAELIRELNGLSTDRILVGQVLLVRESPRPVPPCPPTVCGIPFASDSEFRP